MQPAKINCPLCEDTGWKTVSDSSSKTSRVARCDCKRYDQLLAQARIPKRYEHCTISNYQTEFHGEVEQSLARARVLADGFVANYPLDQTGLLFIGNAGIGKTHLSVGIIKQLILSKGIQCVFYDYRELLKEIQNSYNPSVQTTELEVLRPVFEAEVLLLDELGAAKPTEWVWDAVSLILNTRYNDKRTTIITTNFPNGPAGSDDGNVSQLSGDKKRAAQAARGDTLGDRIGERMRSRLHEMCRIVEMEGQDFRKTVNAGEGESSSGIMRNILWKNPKQPG